MLWLLVALAATPIDVSQLKVAAPVLVAELDLGKLKGDLRQIGWSPDGTQLYVQTVDGGGASRKVRHYLVSASGVVSPALEHQPDWAEAYWAFKSDRAAPGLGWILIDLEQKAETIKIGTGSAGAADRTTDPIAGGGVMTAGNVEREAERQKQRVVRLTLFGEAISEFVNTQPIPGLMFGWGPEGSGAIAFTTREGRLVLLDQQKRRQAVAGVNDALLPAWSIDGARLAWAQKSGRKKYKLMTATLSAR